MSLVLLAIAAREWTSSRIPDAAGPARRSGSRGALILLGVSLGLVGGLWVASAQLNH